MAEGPRWLERAVAELAAPVAEDPAARARLSRRLRDHAGERWWLLRPRLVALTPLRAGVAAALLLLLGAAGGARLAGDRSPARAAPTEAGAAEVVAFVFVAAEASSVTLVGDFNGWRVDATPLARTGEGGTWTVALPLSPGRYTYSFVVDGTEWRPDPVAPPAPGEEFGRPSSIVVVEANT